VDANSELAVLRGLVSQDLSRRASEAIPLGIVGEGAGQKCAAAPLRVAFAGLPTLLPRSIKVHAPVRRGRDRSMMGIVAIGHHLLRVASQSLLAALQSRRELMMIDTLGRSLDIDDHPLGSVVQQRGSAELFRLLELLCGFHPFTAFSQ
jgi:hypothetical protein